MKLRALASVAVFLACVGTIPVSASQKEQVVPVEAMPRNSLAGQSIYFVMIDRYANGNVANDGGTNLPGFKPNDPKWFHGGDLQGLANNMSRIKSMGFTALWITPPVVQNPIQGATAAYHGYWGVNFTTIDPRFGSEDDFKKVVETAHGLGLKVYLDVVLNHTGDVIRYQDGGSFSTSMKKAYIPEGSPQKSPAWLNELSSYNNRGDASSCNWTGDDCNINGDFFGLDDIDTSRPEVLAGWTDVWSEWIRKYRIDGFRIDTAKHVDQEFLKQWQANMKTKAAEYGVKDFAIFGEFYDAVPFVIQDYLRKSELPSALDFGAQKAIVDFASMDDKAQDLKDLFAQDDLYNFGLVDSQVVNAYSLVTFGGNHDMGRIARKVQDIAFASDSELLKRVLLAHAVLFTSRGTPVVMYGDEVGMMGDGGDSSARQDMFATKVSAWQSESRVGSGPIRSGSSLASSALSNPIARYITTLNGLRKNHPALASGAMQPRVFSGSVASWSRFDRNQRKEYLVAANASAKVRRITLQTSSPKTTFIPLLGTKARVTSSSTGTVTIAIPALTTLVYQANKALPQTSTAPSVVVSWKQGVANAAVGKTLDPVSVTFAQRDCPQCPWTTIATDDNAPYQVPMAQSPGRELIAAVQTSDGKVRQSLPFTLK